MPARNGAGRPRGVPNKQSRLLQEYVADTGKGLSPGRVMLDRMYHHYSLAALERAKGAQADPKLVTRELLNAAHAAEKVAPYIHTRLQAVMVTGDEDGGPVRLQHGGSFVGLTPAELAKLSAEELARVYRATIGEAASLDGEPGPHPNGNGSVPT